MKTENMLMEMAIRTGTRKIIWILLLLSILSNFFLAIKVATQGTIVQTILTPPEIRRTLTVSNTAFSKEYLEELAPYNAYLLLNVTPETIDYQSEQLLKMTASEYREALEKELHKTRRWIKQNNVSTYYTSISAAADPNDNTVKLKGIFEVKKSDKILERRNREFLVSYNNSRGKIELLSIREIIRNQVAANPKEAKSGDEMDLNIQEQPTVQTEQIIDNSTTKEFTGGQ